MQIDVTGLFAGLQYYYGFSVPGNESISGAAVSYTVRSPCAGGTNRLQQVLVMRG